MPSSYADLAGALQEARRVPVVVTPTSYAFAHHLPWWDRDFRQHPASDRWLGMLDDYRTCSRVSSSVIHEVIAGQAADLKNPPHTWLDVVTALERCGLARFGAQVRVGTGR